MKGIITDTPRRAGQSAAFGTRGWIIALILAGFAARVIFLGLLPSSPSKFDQATYLRQARKLQTTAFAEWEFDRRAPVYLVFLAGAFTVSGGADKEFVRLAQALLGAGAVAWVYGLTQLTFAPLARRVRSRVALLAAALWAFYPDALFFTQTYYSETLFVFFALGAFCFLLRASRANALAHRKRNPVGR